MQYIVRPLLIFPRFKAASLIGAYNNFKSKGDIKSAIKCLQDILDLSRRPRRKLKDDIYLINAYCGLFLCNYELNNYDDAVKYGLEAVTLLSESHNSGWELFEESGDSKYTFLLDLKRLIQVQGIDANNDKLQKLSTLIETIEQYKIKKGEINWGN